MSGNSVYAAGLGLLIPLVGTSVCRKLWNHGLLRVRGRTTTEGKGLFNVTLVVQVAVLAASCYAFHHVASSMKMEPEHFDPYHILDLPARANSTVIRSQYRRLSLKHHPDKNPGNRSEANKKFNKVAKAYKALSDPQARRNWEQYGHPDGYQPWTFDLAVPGWLRPGKDTGNGTLALYGLCYMAVLIGFVVSVKVILDMMDPAGGNKKPQFEVTEEDVDALLENLDDSSSTADVLECLAASPQLCSEERRVLAEDMEPITAPLRQWLLNLEGGAPPLRGPRPCPPTQPSAGQGAAPPNKATARRGKGKGSTKGKSKGGDGGAGEPATSTAAAATKKKEEEVEVEGEFFSRGRKGEGNRRSARESPELSGVVKHNLVVLLSALHRAPSSCVVDTGDDGDGGGGGAGAASGVVASAAEAGEADEDDSCQEASRKAGGTVAKRERTEGGGHGDGAEDGAGAESRLLAAVDAGGQLARERDRVVGLAEPLLDACLRVAARRPSPQLFGTVVETKAMLRRRLWSSQDPSATDRQQEEADMELDAAVPSIKVKSVVVETWGESQVALGDTVTATITIVREHAPEYQGFRRRRPEAGSFLAKGEPWWVILAGGKDGGSLIGVAPMLVDNLSNGVAECKMKFQAPTRPGFVNLTVSVKSPVFVGVDCEGSASFRVWRHDELKEDEDAGDW